MIYFWKENWGYWLAIAFLVVAWCLAMNWMIDADARARIEMKEKRRFCHAKMQTFEDFERCTK